MAYSATIISSKKELTKREKIQLKDMTDVIRLDSATKEGNVVIEEIANIIDKVGKGCKQDKECHVTALAFESGGRAE